MIKFDFRTNLKDLRWIKITVISNGKTVFENGKKTIFIFGILRVQDFAAFMNEKIGSVAYGMIQIVETEGMYSKITYVCTYLFIFIDT